MNEFQSFDFELKEIGEGDDSIGTFKGYGSTFNNVDRVNDIVMPGAFKGSIGNPKKIAFLWQHDTKEVIGGFTKLEEDEKGLYMEGEFNLDVQRGKEAYALMKKGHINSFSIGYQTKKDNWRADGVRELIKVKLHEVSAVTIPANPKATRTSVKQDIDVTIREFEKQLLEGSFGRKEAREIISIAKDNFAFKSPDTQDAIGNEAMQDAGTLNEEQLAGIIGLRDAFKALDSLISK